MTGPRFRLITFEEWRTYPFSVQRWAVFAIEVAIAVAFAWHASTRLIAWSAAGLILAADYLWTCGQVARRTHRTPPRPH